MKMICPNCSQEIDDKEKFCPFCGSLIDKEAEPKQKQNVPAIVGFVFSFLIAIVGLIYSISGYRRSALMNDKGKGLSIAGIVISLLSMFFSAYRIMK